MASPSTTACRAVPWSAVERGSRSCPSWADIFRARSTDPAVRDRAHASTACASSARRHVLHQHVERLSVGIVVGSRLRRHDRLCGVAEVGRASRDTNPAASRSRRSGCSGPLAPLRRSARRDRRRNLPAICTAAATSVLNGRPRSAATSFCSSSTSAFGSVFSTAGGAVAGAGDSAAPASMEYAIDTIARPANHPSYVSP